MLTLYLKHLLIRTPMEPAAYWLKDQLKIPRKLAHPELAELFHEERYIAEALKRVVQANSNCIDIGAHLGSMLSAMVTLAPRGKHMAIEPVPYKAKWLRRKFPEVDIRELALSNGHGEVSFFVNVTRPGYSGLSQHFEKGDQLEKITVQQIPLDELIGDTHRLDFMKIDVEGGEFAVLQGAKGVIERCRPSLVFESTATGLAACGVRCEDVFGFMEAQGYQVHLPRTFVERGPALSLAEFEAAHVYPFPAFNFLATPRT